MTIDKFGFIVRLALAHEKLDFLIAMQVLYFTLN